MKTYKIYFKGIYFGMVYAISKAHAIKKFAHNHEEYKDKINSNEFEAKKYKIK